MTQACSQATWYRINVRIMSSPCCLGAVTDICDLQGLWVMFKKKKKKKQPKTLSLTAWFACNWVAKRLHAAICTVENIYRIVSASVNECLCVWGSCWLNIQGLWGNGIIRLPAPKTTKREMWMVRWSAPSCAKVKLQLVDTDRKSWLGINSYKWLQNLNKRRIEQNN